METEPGYKKAGISRYGLNVIQEMARLAPDDQFELYVNVRFTRPESWTGLTNICPHIVKKYRTHRYLAGMRSLAQGFNAWFVPSYDALEFCLVPQISMIHDVFPFTNPEWFTPTQVPAMKRSIGRAISVAKTLLVNSESTRQSLSKNFRIPIESITVTPLALGNQASPTSPKKDGKYFVAIGTIEPRKNLARLLEAWSRIQVEFPDVVFVMVGAKGWNYEGIQTAAFNLGDRVKYVSYVSDDELPTLVSQAEFYVLASLDEGFGMPILEAMAYGAPLVLSDRPAMHELAGDLATYFDPLSTHAIESALRAGLSQTSARPKLVAQGQELARKFTWERTAQLTLEAIHRTARKP